jgi:hypothetical protein
MYDSREEDTFLIGQNFRSLLSTLSFIRNDNDENLVLFDESYTDSFSKIKYADMFTLYFTNKYMTVSSNDLAKISSWLDESWSLNLNSKSFDSCFFFASC